ncbi:unnamed protein product [Cladocopium goreaui]|uniref:Uncharacterized protein n=1 Tax=Cladocopium goreaui TaxID=2562237 RepID=A0A9P1G4G9_9DINO|nr:unnamed protein product [Cladocopium goreaui]CAI3999231.1 unnamed protein product [Cladocopium goreaui]CAI4000732.1 unnamed protein product [Cladocopium goreaui]
MLKCPKVLALCILMIIWTPTFKCNQEYQLFEFFAGNANLSKCARASGLTTASFDILFDAQKPGRSYGSNSMDILSDSGFALCLHSLLCSAEEFLATFAIKCSSWSAVNRGTSFRTPCTSIGYEEYESVYTSNTMAGRLCLLLIVVTALGGAWFVEQPEQSVLEYFPPFQSLLAQIFEANRGTAVFRAKWYMAHYGGLSAKPHYAWGNSPHLSRLCLGPLLGRRAKQPYEGPLKVKTCKTYKNKKGETCYTGNSNLRKSEQYPVRFGFKIVDLYSDLVSSALGKTPVPKVTPKATESYEGMPDEIGALDYAQVINVFNYLRQGKDLIIPNQWSHLVPKPLL